MAYSYGVQWYAVRCGVTLEASCLRSGCVILNSVKILYSLKFTMRYSSFILAVILPFTLAITMSLVIFVNGDMCGAMTQAEPGDDRATLMKKAFDNFRSTCRKGANKGQGSNFTFLLEFALKSNKNDNN